jgi:hypothetical protein
VAIKEQKANTTTTNGTTGGTSAGSPSKNANFVALTGIVGLAMAFCFGLSL